MEDYEKKYKETIAWIDIIMPTLTKEQQEDALENFPELAESEDERIRKDIIRYLKESIGDEDIISPWLTWLEKQGEKDKLIKELGEYKVKYTQEVLEKHINSMNDKDDERLRKTTIAFLKDFAEQGYENAVECIDWLEKQGKRNPVWSEEDPKRIDYICDFIWKNRKGDTDEIYQQEQDVKWLKSLKQRLV